MRIKNFICGVLVWSIWTSLFLPIVNAQTVNSSGLQYTVSEVKTTAQKPTIKPPIETAELSQSERFEILKRLPPMAIEEDETADFEMRGDTVKPPKTGKVIPIKFPADESETAPEISEKTSKPLRIERYTPTGKTDFVTNLTVKFSQPMVANTSQTEASETIPIKITPEVKGKWRWLGADTLTLDAETRFPMGTKFTVTIPKETKSVIGGVLTKDFTWAFTTPPPKVLDFVPEDRPQHLKPEHTIMAAKFNQEIDETEVLPKIKVLADGKEMAIKSATAEIQDSTTVYHKLKKPKAKHFIAFRTVETLPIDTEVKVLFEKGIPSTEGTAISEKDQNFKFRTLPNFQFTDSRCGYQSDTKNCEPSDDFSLRFNSSFSNYPKPFDTGLITIEPKIDDAKIKVNQGEILISGTKKPNTTYKVTVSGESKSYQNLVLGEDAVAIFKVRTEHPQFVAANAKLVTLDPNSKPVFSIFSQNQPSFKVKLYSVTPADYLKFREVFRKHDRGHDERLKTPVVEFGELVLDKTFEINAETDEFVETQIEINKFMSGKFGHFVIVAEPAIIRNDRYNRKNYPFIKWLQATNIGLDTLVDYEKLFTYVSDLKTAKPIKNAAVSMNYGSSTVLNSTADETGIAKFELANSSARVFILAENKNDSAILTEPNDHHAITSNWEKRKPWDILRWYVFDDRKMYRPNEEVSIKGYVRKVTGGTASDIAEVGDRAKKVYYSLRDPRYNEIVKGEIDLNAFGAFDFKIKLPENGNLGYQRLSFWAQESQRNQPEFTHTFQVQEFRRPEFEVSVKAETPVPFYVGEKSLISATATYYTGGPLADSELYWSLLATQTRYSPPNNANFTFGTFVPWWREHKSYGGISFINNEILNPQNSISGKTDENGIHQFDLDIKAANPARPYLLQATANITDVNRQNIANTKMFLVHPSNFYVGIRSEKNFVRPNETFEIEAIATDIDGKYTVNAPITIKAEFKEHTQVGGSTIKEIVDTQSCEIASAKDVVSCDFKAKKSDFITITATVLDEKERPNTSELTIWVAGGETAPNRKVDDDEIELIPDKRIYLPGDTAELLVNAPFFPAEGIMTLERNGIVKTERFTLSESATVLKVPIEEKYLPNLHVKVDLIGNVKRTNDDGEIIEKLPKRPALAHGTINLEISTESRQLNIAVSPINKTLKPGEKTEVKLEVKDNLGNPVQNSEVALVAVDEGVLALTNYEIKNPLEAFYQTVGTSVQRLHSRKNILLANPELLDSSLADSTVAKRMSMNGLGLSSGYQIDGAKAGVYKNWDSKDIRYIITDENNKNELSIRRNFDALAIFSPSVKTDENGTATVDIKLPDNLTRYRITAVAVTDSKQFGLGESNITAKKSLQIRPSAPRFLNYGDNAELPVVLQNETDSSMTVNVAIRSKNAKLTASEGKKITIPANDRAEIRFPVSTEKSGYARFQIGAISGEFADAAEIVLPVYTPATTESFTTYGTTNKNGVIVQQVSSPKDVFADYGGLEITTSSTQLQELTDAFIYLQSYQFACSEQIASRVLSVAAVRDVLSAFKAKDMPKQQDIEAKMKEDIERLQMLQHDDGGWSFWKNSDKNVPYVSVHVAHAIARAKAKGYEVPQQMIDKSMRHLTNIESSYPKEYSEKSRWAISAYALYVRDLLGTKDTAKAKKLLEENGLENLSIESNGWLLSVLADDKNSVNEVQQIKQHLLNRVTETSGQAHFVTNYEDGEFVLLSSERRADAVILEALLKVESRESRVESSDLSNLIPKIVRDLLAHRIKGRWQSTQENAFVLLALDKYFQTYEKTTPNFIAKMWLGKAFVGKQTYTERSTNSNLVKVPMKYLQTKKNTQKLILDRQGEGRLYYRIGLKYAPKNLRAKSADYGFVVSRNYEAIDNQDDVKQNADGSWTIKSGSRLRVNVQLVAPTRRYHVALVDNLPAGIEIVNTALATSRTGNNYLRYTPEQRIKSFWFEHQNLRDNRAEAFTTILKNGVWNYSYMGTATTPGEFVVPPAKAEEMYSPETFGRSKTDIVKIE